MNSCRSETICYANLDQPALRFRLIPVEPLYSCSLSLSPMHRFSSTSTSASPVKTATSSSAPTALTHDRSSRLHRPPIKSRPSPIEQTMANQAIMTVRPTPTISRRQTDTRARGHVSEKKRHIRVSRTHVKDGVWRSRVELGSVEFGRADTQFQVVRAVTHRIEKVLNCNDCQAREGGSEASHSRLWLV